MINWIGLAGNALWIVGCALALATLSHAHWTAGLQGIRLRQQIQAWQSQIALSAAGLLFCLGLGVTSDQTLETVLWLLLSLAFLVQLVQIRRRLR
jgi:hypothetical protein